MSWGAVGIRSGGLWVCGVVLVLVALCVPAAASADEIDQAQTSASTGVVGIQGPSNASGPESQAQVFTAGVTGQLDRVQLYLSGSGNSSPLTVEITNTVSGPVPGSSVLASAQVQPASVSSSPGWVEAGFSPAPQVSAGTKYAIVAYASGSDDYAWGATTTAPFYAGGEDFKDTTSSPPLAADWEGLSSLSQAFKTFVALPPSVSVTSPGPGTSPGSGTAGSVIPAGSISAMLYNGLSPSGSITFKVFGPQSTAPTDCSAGTTVGTATVSGDGTYHPSPGFTPSQVGDYWWYASYGGDSNNASASSSCVGVNQLTAETVVGQALPSLGSVSAPNTGTAGSAISAGVISGALSGGAAPGGTITFKVFGPQSTAPTDCSAGTTVGTATVSGDGTYHPSAGFTPSQVGDYWWYASYGGDSNDASASSSCDTQMVETIVGQASPSLGVSAPGSGTTGTEIDASSISVVLSGGASPGGSITFRVFGPQPGPPTDCSGWTTSTTSTVSQDGTYHPSTGFTPSQPGDYWWYATYTGDPNNNATSSTCGAGMTETSVSLPSPPHDESLPVISGTAKQGSTLKTTTGTWIGPDTLTYTYQWERCTATGTNCTKITGATHSTYKPTSTDTGHKITVVVSATDREHQTTRATAKPTGPIKT